MTRLLIVALLGTASFAAAPLHAQAGGGLVDMTVEQLRPEIDRRYQEALQATQTPGIIGANDMRYTMASEAKIACGIAIGYLKSNTRDRETIERCDFAYQHMQATPPPETPPPLPEPSVPAVPPSGCAVASPIIIFFDWNAATPLGDAQTFIDAAKQGVDNCGWARLNVVGFTDKSGTDAYNLGLSDRRATNIGQMLEAAGIPGSSITTKGLGESNPKVNTVDGVREPTNRRVEITPEGGAQ